MCLEAYWFHLRDSVLRILFFQGPTGPQTFFSFHYRSRAGSNQPTTPKSDRPCQGGGTVSGWICHLALGLLFFASIRPIGAGRATVRIGRIGPGRSHADRCRADGNANRSQRRTSASPSYGRPRAKPSGKPTATAETHNLSDFRDETHASTHTHTHTHSLAHSHTRNSPVPPHTKQSSSGYRSIAIALNRYLRGRWRLRRMDALRRRRPSGNSRFFFQTHRN